MEYMETNRITIFDRARLLTNRRKELNRMEPICDEELEREGFDEENPD